MTRSDLGGKGGEDSLGQGKPKVQRLRCKRVVNTCKGSRHDV